MMAKKRTGENIKKIIIDSTQALLQNKTFSEISLKEIAKVADISQGTLYYYYKTKDDLAVDVYFKYLDNLIDETVVWISNKEKDTSIHRIAKFTVLKGSSNSYLRLNSIIASSTNERIRSKLLNSYDTFYQTFYDRLKDYFCEEDTRFLAWLFPLITDGINVQKYLKNPDFDIPQYAKDSEDFFLKVEKIIK